MKQIQLIALRLLAALTLLVLAGCQSDSNQSTSPAANAAAPTAEALAVKDGKILAVGMKGVA